MSSQEDPEARIRELERSLGDQVSEPTRTGYVPPPPPPSTVPPWYGPPPPYGPPVQVSASRRFGSGWVIVAVLGAVVMAIIAGVVIVVSNAFSTVNSALHTFDGRPTASGGGPFGAPSSSWSHVPAPTGDVPVAPPASVVPAGGQLNVSGAGIERTIACNDGAVGISGVDNTIVLTGQCRSVTVSGARNVVSVDAAAAITASGFGNRVTYHSGTPDVQNVGDSNVVDLG